MVFSLTETSDSQDSRDRRRNHCFSCFPLPPAHEHWFRSLRFLQLFNQSICNYQIGSWWDFFSWEIYILFPFSLMQLSRRFLEWHFEDSSSYQTIILLLQSEHFNQLKLTPITTTIYLSHLPYPTHSHHLSSIRLPKCIRNEGCFIFFFFFFF